MQSMPARENSNEEAEQEALDFTQPDFSFQPREHHEWRQKGPYLVCKSCEIEHAVYIGQNKQLIGLDEEGKPILKEVEDWSKV